MRWLALFYALVLLTLTFPGEAEAVLSPEKKARFRNLQIWSFQAVSAALTFNIDNFESRLRENSALFTPAGCRSFMLSMLNYGLSDGAAKDQDSIIVKGIWKKRVVTDIHDQIRIDEEEEDKARKGFYTWQVEVPLLLTLTNDHTARDYRFVVVLRIKQVEAQEGGYKISRWSVNHHRDSIQPKYFKAYRPRKDYAFCYTLYPDDD